MDLLAKERQEAFRPRKEHTCVNNKQDFAHAKEAIRKDARGRLVERWQMCWHGEQTWRWTHRLIPELATWLERKLSTSSA